MATRPGERMHESKMRLDFHEHFNYYYRFPQNHHSKDRKNLAGRFLMSDCPYREDKGIIARLRPNVGTAIY